VAVIKRELKGHSTCQKAAPSQNNNSGGRHPRAPLDDGNMHRLMDTHELFIHSGVMQPAWRQHHKLISRQPLLMMPLLLLLLRDELQNKLCPATSPTLCMQPLDR
jgi:hypothetical protein